MIQRTGRQSSPRRSRAGWISAAAAVCIAASCGSVRAQTGPTLLLKPFPKEQAIDAGADALFFALDYDGNRPILPDVPLPGVAYTKRVARDFFFVIGAPVTSIEWRPDDRLRVELVYTVPDRLDASLGYRFAKGFTVFGNFEN